MLKELCRQTEYFLLLLSWDTVQKDYDSPKARPFYMRMIEAEIENFFSVQGIDQIALKQRSMLRKSLQVWYHPLQFRFEAIHSCHYYIEQSEEVTWSRSWSLR